MPWFILVETRAGGNIVEVDMRRYLDDGSYFVESASYSYVVDGKTGVVYIVYHGASSAGITVVLNPDGSPVTIDQIKAQEKGGVG